MYSQWAFKQFGKKQVAKFGKPTKKQKRINNDK